MEATPTLLTKGTLSAFSSSLRNFVQVWLVALLAGPLGTFASAADSVSKEYQLKAAFLYNFAKFVEWPAQSFADADSPIVIGVIGTDPFGSELETAVRGRKINGRRIVLKPVQTASDVRQTHLLFVGRTQDARLEELMGTLQGLPVLTVGESAAFVGQGGMITFKLQNDTLRFEINMDSAQKAGLKMSAQLQKLATAIRR